MCISIFLLNPFVRRVKRRMPMRIVRFARSTCEVEIIFTSGEPLTTIFVAPTHTAGLPRRFASTTIGLPS